jgi:hypothetical protein
MKKASKQKPKPKVKREKPLKLEMSFDEAMHRLARVEKPGKK